jgi:hypothetical protein
LENEMIRPFLFNPFRSNGSNRWRALRGACVAITLGGGLAGSYNQTNQETP